MSYVNFMATGSAGWFTRDDVVIHWPAIALYGYVENEPAPPADSDMRSEFALKAPREQDPKEMRLAFQKLNEMMQKRNSVETGLIAAISQVQGNCPLLRAINVIETVQNENDVATLPSAAEMPYVVVINAGANTLQIYPATDETIDNGAANASTTLAAGSSKELVAVSTTAYRTV